MENSEKMYYRIGDVAKMFGEKISAIRYWEKEFKQLKTKKNLRGVRYFTPEDIKTLKTIHYLLRVKKMRTAGARQALEQDGDKIHHKMEVLEKLETIKTLLENVKNKL